MKRILSIIGLLLLVATTQAQYMRVHNSGDTMYASPVAQTDSIKLDATYARFKISGSSSFLRIQKAFIDSITFTNNPVTLTKIYIIWNGTDTATIINPYAAQGVTITAVGGTVTATAASGISNLEYNLLGTSTNGSLTISSTTPATFVMNNLTLTNPSGAAIRVTGGQTHTFISRTGTTNSLSDGATSARDGALQTNGKIIFSGTGTLTLKGIAKHGVSTSGIIEMQSSTVTVTAALSDGFHSEGFVMSGGTATVSASTGDGIDAGDGAMTVSGGTINVTSTSTDVKAFKTGNGAITISGGTFNLNVSGGASKAISSKKLITINGGTFVINLSGTAIPTASGSGYSESYCTAIKSDTAINISGGSFTVQTSSTAKGAKGISSDKNIAISNGTFNINTAGADSTYINTSGVADTYSTAAFSADANINISGGQFTLVNSGNSGRVFTSDSTINVTGGTITATNSGTAGRGFNADKNVVFDGGTTVINLSGATVLTASGSGYDPSYPTGVKADGIVYVNSGAVTINGTATATGARGLSADSIISVSGGTVNVKLAGAGTTYTNAAGTIDSYAAAAFSSDKSIVITGGIVTDTCTGAGGKCLKSDGGITIGSATGNPVLTLTTTGARFLQSGSGSTVDYNHPKVIVANKAINILNGTLNIASTDDGIHSDSIINISGGNHKVVASSTLSGVGEGIEAPIINFSGGVTNVTASNDGVNCTKGTVVGGIESNDSSQLTISGGILIAAGSDAIDANGNLTITGGTTIVCGPTSQPEEGIDFNGTFNMNGGILISGGSNTSMTKAMSNTSTQVGMYLKSSAQLAATSVLHIENASGVESVTFKPKNAVYYFHFSRPELTQGTQYKVYFGGTYTGGSFIGNSSGWGMYTGGTWSSSGATLKSTFTTSTTTKVNTVSF